jgi:hypothetical protein
MKKLLIITFISLLFYSCTTTEKIVSSGKIRENISKSELMDAFLISYPSDDPFLPEGGSEFFSEKNSEIIWGSNKKKFYVFKNVSEPVSCGIIFCRNGNGTLESWHDSLELARESISKIKSNKKNISKSDTIYSKSPDVLSKTESERRLEFANRWNDPGYTEAGFPQTESFWIFIKNPPPNSNAYAEMACRIAKSEYNLKGFTIRVWNFNKKEFGIARCF